MAEPAAKRIYSAPPPGVPACFFCGGHAMRGPCLLQHEIAASPSGRSEPEPYYLCWDHSLVLSKAGEKGKVHKRTGLRWWWVGQAGAPIGDPAVPRYEG